MSREEKALYAQLSAAIAAMQNPKSNPAADFLSQEAISAANFMKSGEFGRALPKGMFFNFEMPAADIERYKKLTNVGQGGTFALANNGGRSQAQGLASKYLGDRFARDAMNNYQNNISNASQRIYGALGGVADATQQNQLGVVNALQGMFNSLSNRPKSGGLGGLLGGIGGILGAI